MRRQAHTFPHAFFISVSLIFIVTLILRRVTVTQLVASSFPFAVLDQISGIRMIHRNKVAHSVSRPSKDTVA